jgi:hypothetical protein
MVRHTRQRNTGRQRRRRNGQAMTEFALILPIVIFIIWSLIYGGFLFIQNEEIVSSARAAARAGSIEYVQKTIFGVSKPGGVYCEAPPQPGAPNNWMALAVDTSSTSIPLSTVNMCTPPGTTLTQPVITMTQSPPPGPGQVQITAVITQPSGQTPNVTVTVTYQEKGLAPPFNSTFIMKGQSQDPAAFPS